MATSHFRSRRTRRLWTTGLTLTALALFAVVFVAASSANLAGSTFEGNDGNLVVNTAGNHDWDNAPNLSVGQDVADPRNDNAFGQGAKEDDVNVSVVTGSIPNAKANLARFALAGEVIGGQTYMYLAWSREDQSGTVNFDFELNKLAQPDLTTAGAKVLNRSVNDALINYAFQGGSNTPTLTRYHWNGSNWVNDGAIAGACSEGATNAATVSENLGGLTAVNRPAQQFGEAAINLSCAGIVPPNTCESFGSGYVKSRSSTSFTSEIKDFIAPVHLSFPNLCGKLTIIKHTNPRGLDQAFGYTTTGGLSPATFTLNDAGNSGGGDSAGNTRVYDNLQPGTYSVTEGADPVGFAFASASCTTGGTVSDRTATATIVAGSDITCTYINDQQLGSIKVLKQSIKGNAPLAGAVFSIEGHGSITTGDDGTACIDGLTFGDYDVTEVSAPGGYAIDNPDAVVATVSTNSSCPAGDPSSTLTFSDAPLTDIAASANSQATGPGATSNTVSCVDGNGNAVGNSPQGPAEDPAVAATGLRPGTYTCTIVVDP